MPNPIPDTLNTIGVLKRREIEARILAPYVEALAAEFGRERVVEILRGVIINVARQHGAALAEHMGDNSLGPFRAATEAWKKDDALTIEVLEQTGDRYAFNVTRCRYAEMYHALGIPELGAVLSCNRDFTLIEGYNPDVELTRTQTLMQGASHCDFRYVRRPAPPETPLPNPGHEAA
ncbi:MAG: L-2-amino-thiazoline-4-carboxylic acid hydrolase [Anaerolineales bacterium]